VNHDYPPIELLVATVVAPFKAQDGEATQWLETANSIIHDAKETGFTKIHWMAAMEMDSRGLSPYSELLSRMDDISIHEGIELVTWKYAIDDGSERLDTHNRLVRICTGRNLIHEYASRTKPITHVLFLDSDITPDGDCVSKLIEVDADVVGGHVPAYCLSGSKIGGYPFPVERHWNTAGFLFVRRRVVDKIRWRSSVIDSGCSDDPCFNIDAIDAGFEATLVRKDVIGRHPDLKELGARGHDLRIHKS